LLVEDRHEARIAGRALDRTGAAGPPEVLPGLLARDLLVSATEPAAAAGGIAGSFLAT
jgi:hypothetical protein